MWKLWRMYDMYAQLCNLLFNAYMKIKYVIIRCANVLHLRRDWTMTGSLDRTLNVCTYMHPTMQQQCIKKYEAHARESHRNESNRAKGVFYSLY